MATIGIFDIAFAQAQKQDAGIEFNAETLKMIQHLKKGENDLAINLAKSYLSSNPNNITALNILTEAYINKGDLSSAETTVRRAMTIQSKDPWSCRLLARIYRIKPEGKPAVKKNNLILASDEIERALVFAPDDIGLLSEAAKIYSEQGNKDKANQMIERALRIASDDDYLLELKKIINRTAEGKY